MKQITVSELRHQAPGTVGFQHHSGTREAQRNGQQLLGTLPTGRVHFCVNYKVWLPRRRTYLVYFGSAVHLVIGGREPLHRHSLTKKREGLYILSPAEDYLNKCQACKNPWPTLHMGWIHGNRECGGRIFGTVVWCPELTRPLLPKFTTPAPISISYRTQGNSFLRWDEEESDRNPFLDLIGVLAQTPFSPLNSSCQQTDFTWPQCGSQQPLALCAPSMAPQCCLWEVAPTRRWALPAHMPGDGARASCSPMEKAGTGCFRSRRAFSILFPPFQWLEAEGIFVPQGTPDDHPGKLYAAQEHPH